MRLTNSVARRGQGLAVAGMAMLAPSAGQDLGL